MAYNWSIIERHFDTQPYPYHVYMDTMVNEFPKVFGDGLTRLFVLFENGHFTQLFDKDDWLRVGRTALEKLSNANFAKQVALNSRNGIEELFGASKKYLQLT